jgi:ABC-2 type transport system permease protein
MQTAFISRMSALFFIIGKLLRFSFFLFFLFILITKTKSLAGYSSWQVVFFYLNFTLIDTVTQLLLREVYKFRPLIISGNFDYDLIKPFSPLFRSLFGGTDPLDIPLLLISVIGIFIGIHHIGYISLWGYISYILLLLNALVLAISFHIAVLGLGVLTTEVDNAIMLYRDLSQMGRVPVDIYKEPLRGIVTFIIPVGIIMTIPVKALIGLTSFPVILIAFFLSGVFLFLSMKLWYTSLEHYTSASS